jgi:hypothetical protein
MLPLLPRGVRLTVAPELGRVADWPFDRTLGLLLRATLPLRLRFICGALWLRLILPPRLTLPELRLTCGERLRLTLLELRLTWGAL